MKNPSHSHPETALRYSAAQDDNGPQAQAWHEVLPLVDQFDHVAQKVLIVDQRIPDYQRVVDAAEPGVKVVLLDSNRDGVTQIAEALKGMHGIDSISIVSHGDQGLALLGDAPLFAGDMGQYAAQLHSIGQTLGPDGDILLYGCNIGAGSAGKAFLDALAGATGADVAASLDNTGGGDATAQGGNWDLEITSGKIDSAAAMDIGKLSDYAHLLAASTSVSTVVALQAALTSAASDNIDNVITLTGNLTFTSAADTLAINLTDSHKLTIVGGGKTLDAAYLTRALTITAGTVEIQNLTITHGMLSGNGGNGSPVDNVGVDGGSVYGGAIKNSGTLTLNSVTVTANGAAGGGGGGGGAHSPWTCRNHRILSTNGRRQTPLAFFGAKHV